MVGSLGLGGRFSGETKYENRPIWSWVLSWFNRPLAHLSFSLSFFLSLSSFSLYFFLSFSLSLSLSLSISHSLTHSLIHAFAIASYTPDAKQTQASPVICTSGWRPMRPVLSLPLPTRLGLPFRVVLLISFLTLSLSLTYSLLSYSLLLLSIPCPNSRQDEEEVAHFC